MALRSPAARADATTGFFLLVGADPEVPWMILVA
jgi:hypothetical protein